MLSVNLGMHGALVGPPQAEAPPQTLQGLLPLTPERGALWDALAYGTVQP